MAHTKPKISIHLSGAESPLSICSYTTGDVISGHVEISVDVHTPCDTVTVAFQGRAKTFIDKSAPLTGEALQTDNVHYFHNVRQTTSVADLRAAETRHTSTARDEILTIPFAFLVPPQLTPTENNFPISHPELERYQSALPPCIGDCDVAGDGAQHLDDHAPEMAKISYLINVKILSLHETENGNVLDEALRKLRIMPASPEVKYFTAEDPRATEAEYIVRAEKNMKQSLIHRLGQLTVESSEPQNIELPLPGSSGPPTPTFYQLKLNFKPSSAKVKPPPLKNVITELNIQTYFSTAPMIRFPHKNALTFALDQDLSTETVLLSDRPRRAIKWIQCSQDESTPTSNGKIEFSTQIHVPVALPLKYAYIPTFYSRFVARTYSLGVRVFLDSENNPREINLNLPLQLRMADRRSTTSVPPSIRSHFTDIEETVTSEPPPAYME